MSNQINTLLRIDSSARTEGSVSRALTSEFITKLNAEKIISRDLSDGIPLLNAEWVQSTFIAPEERTLEQKDALSFSDTLVEELKAANTIVIGLPVYNFSISASLKAWVDQVCRAGVTFAYTEKGPVGLLTDKKVYLVYASGGVPAGSDYDFATPYMKQAFGFLGITDVTILNAADIEKFDTQKAA